MTALKEYAKALALAMFGLVFFTKDRPPTIQITPTVLAAEAPTIAAPIYKPAYVPIPVDIIPYYPVEAPEIHTEVRPIPVTEVTLVPKITEDIMLPGGISIQVSEEAPLMVVQIPYKPPRLLWY